MVVFQKQEVSYIKTFVFLKFGQGIEPVLNVYQNKDVCLKTKYIFG